MALILSLFQFSYSVKDFREFLNMLGRPVDLSEAYKIILHFFPCNDPSITYPLTIINIDETNVIFREKKDIWLQGVLRGIANAIKEMNEKRFIFAVLSGTHASSLFRTVVSSGAKIRDIPLPLLELKHAKEVILELANRGLVSFCYFN